MKKSKRAGRLELRREKIRVLTTELGRVVGGTAPFTDSYVVGGCGDGGSESCNQFCGEVFQSRQCPLD